MAHLLFVTATPDRAPRHGTRKIAFCSGVREVAAPDRFIAWCKQEEASIEQQLELMKAGKVRTGEDIAG